MKKIINESQLHSIIKESVKKVLKEVRVGSESFHGNNPYDWTAIGDLRTNMYYDEDDDEWNNWNDSQVERDYENAEKLGGSRRDIKGVNKAIRAKASLRESQLRRIVAESVKRVLMESGYDANKRISLYGIVPMKLKKKVELNPQLYINIYGQSEGKIYPFGTVFWIDDFLQYAYRKYCVGRGNDVVEYEMNVNERYLDLTGRYNNDLESNINSVCQDQATASKVLQIAKFGIRAVMQNGDVLRNAGFNGVIFDTRNDEPTIWLFDASDIIV